MWHFWQFTAKGPGEAFGSESLSMDMNRFNGTLNELMEFTGIRIPAVNLIEKFETLDEKVNKLEGIVSSINQTGDAFASGIFGRVDKMEGQLSDLGRSLPTITTTLTQRIVALEQKITNLGNTASHSPVPTDPPLSPPNPNDTPSDLPDFIDPALDPHNPINTPSNNINYATCITTTLNVRSGPGASYPMSAGLRYGQRVKVIKRQDGWAQFEDPAGWSSEAYLSFEPGNVPLPEENPQPTTTSNGYGICNTSGLNVRSGPGVTFPIVGGLTYGQRIKILSHQNGWAQIETPSGWSNESYLSFA